ncbi:MAG TPA: PA14 domain-containing protein, partial [Gemmataceae bacterium]|nr:PA14 domain-containing protein [Gemmataceae bacterium]
MQTSRPAVFTRHRHLTGTALLWLTVVLPPGTVAAAEGRTGEQIFRQRCAACHGATGEGTDKKYPHALVGNRSVAQLARLIARTMPKDAPKKCIGEDAQRVAAYIYAAFYSTAAQARNKPPRIELARLTVRQYRNAVADLVGSFRGPGRWDQQRGLRGQYAKARRFRNSTPAIERIDAAVRFDFGVASPDPKKLEAHAFSIRWQGAVLAPETGDYAFVVRTDHAARLWVNDSKRPLIDAWVKSGSDTVDRASIFLLGGRVYPLRLEFAKGKQGVADNEKKNLKPPPVKASIALEW